MTNEQSIRAKAVELATKTTQNPDSLIKTAEDIYNFLVGNSDRDKVLNDVEFLPKDFRTQEERILDAIIEAKNIRVDLDSKDLKSAFENYSEQFVELLKKHGVDIVK